MLEVGPRKDVKEAGFIVLRKMRLYVFWWVVGWGWKKTIPCITMCGRFYSNSPPSPSNLYNSTTHPRVIEMSLGGRFSGFIEKVIPLGGYGVYDALVDVKRHTCWVLMVQEMFNLTKTLLPVIDPNGTTSQFPFQRRLLLHRILPLLQTHHWMTIYDKMGNSLTPKSVSQEGGMVDSHKLWVRRMSSSSPPAALSAL